MSTCKTVPNQQFIDIHKDKLSPGHFTSINIETWQSAYKELTPSGFGLYMYLASIQDGFKNWALSKVLVQQALGFSETTYKRAKSDLFSHGYLVDRGGNHLDFYTLGVKNDPDVLATMAEDNGVKNDPVVATKQESSDIGVKNGPDNRAKNDPVVAIDRPKMTIENIYTTETDINKQKGSAGKPASLPLDFAELQARAKPIYIGDLRIKKREYKQPFPGENLLEIDGEYYYLTNSYEEAGYEIAI